MSWHKKTGVYLMCHCEGWMLFPARSNPLYSVEIAYHFVAHVGGHTCACGTVQAEHPPPLMTIPILEKAVGQVLRFIAQI
jgi:hypothetical protein